MTNTGENKVAIALGTDDEDKQLEILRALAIPPAGDRAVQSVHPLDR